MSSAAPIAESPLQRAKEQLDIYYLWERYGFEGQPARSCSSPFREDKRFSFSVFEDGRKFKDFSTGESGGLVEFIKLATNLSDEDACRELIQLANTGSVSANLAPRRPRPAREEPRHPFKLPALDGGKISELNQLARSRGFTLFAGLEILRRREQLAFYDSPQGRAWLVSDRAGQVAQARLLSGQNWPAPIAAKAKTFAGSRASWPLGASTITQSTRFVYLMEGGTDLLAAATLAYLTAPNSIKESAFIAMLGASQNIAPEARPLFAGKRIRIFADNDRAGAEAVQRWGKQLLEAQPETLTAWQSDTPGEDLNDFLRSANEGQLQPLTAI